MPSWRAGARVALALSYPLAIYLALQWFEPRWVAAAVVVFVLLRRPRRAAALFGGLSWMSHAVIGGALALSLGALLANDETLLRLYPAGMSFALLVVFALSLVQPPPIVERMARLRRPNLPEEAVRYTRHVTEVWCAFFVVNISISVWSAVAASREVWAIYNGFIVYLVMGALFVGEWLLRRHLFPSART